MTKCCSSCNQQVETYTPIYQHRTINYYCAKCIRQPIRDNSISDITHQTGYQVQQSLRFENLANAVADELIANVVAESCRKQFGYVPQKPALIIEEIKQAARQETRSQSEASRIMTQTYLSGPPTLTAHPLTARALQNLRKHYRSQPGIDELKPYGMESK